MYSKMQLNISDNAGFQRPCYIWNMGESIRVRARTPAWVIEFHRRQHMNE